MLQYYKIIQGILSPLSMERKCRVINLVIIIQLQNCFFEDCIFKEKRNTAQQQTSCGANTNLVAHLHSHLLSTLTHINLISGEQLSNTQGQLLPTFRDRKY